MVLAEPTDPRGDALASLVRRLSRREAKLGVVGLGYVGLPLLLRAIQGGFCGLGLDTDPKKIACLQAGRSYMHQVPSARIDALMAAKQLEPSVDFARAQGCDAIMLCVPTPLTPQREPDMRFIEATCRSLAPHLRPGQLVVLESTTYPGTTEDLVRPLLEAGSHMVAGQDFFLAFSPERQDPGQSEATGDVPKVVGGLTERCREAAAALYGALFTQVVPVSSTRAAEMTKLLENIFRSVNIALVNELKVLCHAMDIDIWEVVDAAATKPFGFMPFYPGPGLGGHCIPIDPFYLTWKAREYGQTTRFIELAGEINARMPTYVVERVAFALNQRRLALHGSRILLLGVAYKRDVDDMRESPALPILAQLQARGAQVAYHDPYIPRLPKLRRQVPALRSVPLTELARYDCAVIVTDHSNVDYAKVAAEIPTLVDSRNVLHPSSGAVSA